MSHNFWPDQCTYIGIVKDSTTPQVCIAQCIQLTVGENPQQKQQLADSDTKCNDVKCSAQAIRSRPVIVYAP